MISKGSMSLFSPTWTLLQTAAFLHLKLLSFIINGKRGRSTAASLKLRADTFQRVINMCLGMNLYLTLWTGLVIGGCVSGCEPSDSGTGNVHLQGEWVTACVHSENSLFQRMSFCRGEYWPRLSHTHASSRLESPSRPFMHYSFAITWWNKRKENKMLTLKSSFKQYTPTELTVR